MNDDKTIFSVVINHEEQYSVWPQGKELPARWKVAGKTGTQQECLDYIKESGGKMLPFSLHKKMGK